MPATSKRIKTLSVSRPIIYGNTAQPLGTKRPPNAPAEHTHTWTVFVKSPGGEDLSYFIKKVVFKLHETYPNATRTVDAPPFQVTETGWGEFEIGIKIYFVSEAAEKNVNLYHHLKLHPYAQGQPAIPAQALGDGQILMQAPKKPETNSESKLESRVESIHYDEIVFNEPTEQLFEIMTQQPGNILPASKSESVFSKETEAEEIVRLEEGIARVKEQIAETQKSIADYIK